MFFEFLSYLIGKILFFTGSVLGGESFLKPLPPEEEKECIRLAAKGDKAAKDKLIVHNMRLVAHVVKKYSGAAETDDLESNALKKLKAKKFDWIAANEVGKPGRGFASDDNAVILYAADGRRFVLPLKPKKELAKEILSLIARPGEGGNTVCNL